MMATSTIKNLIELITPYIDKNKKISEYKSSRLTAPGENYGSLMLRIDFILVDKKGRNEENFSVVAKLIPELHVFQEMFNIQVTCKNETAFYETIIPTFQKFQREQGIEQVVDFFPKFYGARLNLKENSNIVDEDAVLLLENLITSGFKNENRYIGFDVETTKFVLQDLAQFHAIPLALKILQPEVFDKNVRPYMAYLQPESDLPDIKEPAEVLIRILKDDRECIPLIPCVRKSLKILHNTSAKVREPFATLVHRDAWISNFMVKFENNKPVQNRLIDFQIFSYDSPARDLLFFLNTSVQLEVLKKNLDNFIKIYYNAFIQTLNGLKCPTEDFTFNKYLEELSQHAEYEIGHSLFFILFIVAGKKGGPIEQDDPTKTPSLGTAEDTQPVAREKARWIVREYHRRKWISP